MKLIIDGNGLASRARFGTDMPLATSTGRLSGTAYVFLRSLSWTFKELVAANWHTTVIWDAGHSEYRKSLFPGYKVREPSSPENAEQDEIDRRAYIDQCHALHHDFLPALGIRSVRFPRCEADDVISAYATLLAQTGTHQVYILTDDRDFHQLVSPSIYQVTGKGELITESVVEEKWGCTGQRVATIRAMVGDDSDKIPGVKGIGPVRAKKLAPFIDEILEGKFDRATAELKAGDFKWAKVAFDNREHVELNRKLMLLPTNFGHPALQHDQIGMHERDRLMEQLHSRPVRDMFKFFAACRAWEFDFTNDILCSL
jgi:5'-3' exonuclease